MVDLARSIGALGLIHPLVVDVEDVVIAGGHRYAALQLLAAPIAERPSLLATLCPRGSAKDLDAMREPSQLLEVARGVLDFSRIPVRVLPLSQRETPDEAWRAEVAENERRRDYSPGEVKRLAERLKEQGYSFGMGPGPKGAQKALPVLAAVIGRSTRQVKRILSGNESQTRVPYSLDSLHKSLMRFKQSHVKELGVTEHAAIDTVLRILKRHAGK